MLDNLSYKPLTPRIWNDFEQLFGPRGACAGCWCMWWRLSAKEFEANAGENNRLAMKKLVASGYTPGLVIDVDECPAGWIAVAPREDLPRLARSRILKPVDDKPVWTINCLFVDKKFRGRGLTHYAIDAAVEYIQSQGGKIVEAYPKDPQGNVQAAVFIWNGIASTFEKSGFTEVARRSETRPIMRRYLT
ncbi:MAG: GNAT family N-acetyltransferase [Lentisphaeria bacterium]|nr:GNAT family N-acetyltransferase [Candidatus Neomarinimicrobiota bacterium]MCF7842796.1 GNAT family N-acetyltransferase [Lentisphaeria bacterium]